MKSIDLVYEELQAFRSFVEPSRFNFPPRGLRIIRGRNLDTGGSSGAGKSSVNLGLAYAMGYCPFPATELQSWFTDDPPRAEVGLQTPEHQLSVDRGNGLRLVVDGDKKKALKGKAAEAELTKHLGLSPAMLSALTFRQQRSDGTFLSKTNVEIQEFFTTVLGLEVYERAYDDAIKKANALEQDMLIAKGVVTNYQTQLNAATQELQRAEAEYEPLDLAPFETRLAAERLLVEKWKDIRTAVQGRRDAYQLDYRKAIDAQMGDLRTTLKATERDAQQFQRVADGRPSIERSIKASQNRLDVLSKQIVETAMGRCPTCKRPLEGGGEGDQHVAAISEENETLHAELKNLEKNLKVAHEAAETAEQVRAQVQDLEARIKAREIAAGEAFSENLEALRKAFAEAERQLYGAERAANEASAAILSIQAVDNNARTGLEFRRKKVTELQEAIRVETQVVEVKGEQMGVERDFAAMVGREGFLGAIFDEVLAEVAEQTNDILAKVPNVAHVTLAFRSETITGKGTTKRGITPVVTVGGHEAQLKSGCSGGMLGAVYLAADLAVIDVVSRRLGVSPGWLVLDESFEGLGPVEKEAYLEVLDVYAQNKLVLIVDHGTETKEALPGIDLLFQNGRTTIDTSPPTE